MPKLYVFATCEKIITDVTGNVSLIALFNELTVFIPENSDPPPADAVVPKDWVVYSSWEIEPEDAGKEYRHIVEVVYPDGASFGQQSELPVTFPTDKNYNNVYVLSKGFPIGQEGRYAVKMRLEQNGAVVFGPVVIRMDVKYTRNPTKTPI